MQHGKGKTLRCSTAGCLFVTCSQIIRNHRIQSDSKTDGNGIYKILYRINQGERRHGIFADPGDEKAVYNIIK